MATSNNPKVNSDIFTCPICLENIKSPKSLPCLHSFCEQCISEYISATDQKQKGNIESYSCPVCRTVVTPTQCELDVKKWATLLPTNFTLTALMDSISINGQQECHPCKRLKRTSTGVLWCSDCIEALCQNCSDVHKSIKSAVNHKVSKIEDANVHSRGIDVNAISEACPDHSSKQIEAYCFDHKKMCCVLCLTLIHRKCNHVKAIDEIVKNNSDPTEITTVITELQSEIEELIKRRQTDIKNFTESVKTVNENATTLLSRATETLKTLKLSFSKELSILEDKEKAKLGDELSYLKNCLEEADHLSATVAIVTERGTSTQKFIHTENIKTQVKNILSVIGRIKVNKGITVNIAIDPLLNEIVDLPEIGKLSVKTTETSSGANFVPRLLGQLTERSIQLNYKQIIEFQQCDFNCGVCVSDNIIVCGSGKTPCVVAIDTGSKDIKYSHSYHYAKRVAFDTNNRNVYTSYYLNYFSKHNLKNERFDMVYICNGIGFECGGVTPFEDCMYVIVNNSLRKFSLNSCLTAIDQMTFCFYTDTDCSELNGLAIDPKSRHLIYTSKKKEAICSDLNGKSIFRVKDEKTMPRPTSVTVHPSGLLLVGSETGSLHAISRDGNRYWTVIDKCKQIKVLKDVWLNKSGNIIFLCGNQYIEMYDIV